MNASPETLKQAEKQVRAARRKFFSRLLSVVFFTVVSFVPIPFLPTLGPPIIGLSFVGIIVVFCLVDLYLWRLDVRERNRVRFLLGEQEHIAITN